MGQAYFPGPHRFPAPEKTFEAGPVMGAPKGRRELFLMLPKGSFGSARQAVEAADLQGFLGEQVRKYGRHPAGQQGFAAPRRTEDQEVVAAGGGNF
jgi:hypothetical protein